MLSTRPKARLDAPISARPVYSVMRGPARSASRPPGIAPIKVPIAYPAVSTPADALER